MYEFFYFMSIVAVFLYLKVYTWVILDNTNLQ